MENETNIKINYALLKKSKAYRLKKKAEDAILGQISIKVFRSENQAAERKKKRKQSKIKINHQNHLQNEN